MAKPVKYIIRNSSESTNGYVVLTVQQIEMLRLLAEGFEQGNIGNTFSLRAGTTHNYFTFLNEITDCHNPQGLVGWAFKHAVLLPVDRKIIINPSLEIFV